MLLEQFSDGVGIERVGAHPAWVGRKATGWLWTSAWNSVHQLSPRSSGVASQELSQRSSFLFCGRRRRVPRRRREAVDLAFRRVIAVATVYFPTCLVVPNRKYSTNLELKRGSSAEQGAEWSDSGRVGAESYAAGDAPMKKGLARSRTAEKGVQ
jgi:hypothetical protein